MGADRNPRSEKNEHPLGEYDIRLTRWENSPRIPLAFSLRERPQPPSMRATYKLNFRCRILREGPGKGRLLDGAQSLLGNPGPNKPCFPLSAPLLSPSALVG